MCRNQRRRVRCRKTLTKVPSLPQGMTGVFAVDNVSGCFGPAGFFMWGDASHPIMPKGEETQAMKTPKKVEEWSNVKKVRASSTHIIVMLDVAESRKRDAAPQEEDNAKKVEVQA